MNHSQPENSPGIFQSVARPGSTADGVNPALLILQSALPNGLDLSGTKPVVSNAMRPPDNEGLINGTTSPGMILIYEQRMFKH